MTFASLCQYFHRIEQTSSRLEITEILSSLFRESSIQEISEICYLLQGRVAPLCEPVEFGVADKFIIRSIAEALRVSHDDVTRAFRSSGDLGVAAERIAGNRTSAKTMDMSIDDVFFTLCAIANTKGDGSQEKKIAILSQLLISLDSLAVRYVVRILLGKLRLGCSDMTILDALSWMKTGDKSLRQDLEQAYAVRSDIGVIAKIFKKHGVSGLRDISSSIGTPILPALCQRLPTADEMIEKMGEVSVEPKYDGVRIQIHYKWQSAERHKLSAVDGRQSAVGTFSTAFSRNLEPVADMFPELQDIGKYIRANEVILDTEAVGVDSITGAILPFQETTTRKRKHDIQQASRMVPIRFYVFDILYKNGMSLLSLPLSDRKRILEETIEEGETIQRSPYIVTTDANVIRSFHEEQRSNGLEGVVVKKWSSVYESGRRAYNWVKFKEEEGKSGKLQDTIDAVIMGYYYGEGKRSGFGIGAFLVGVRRDNTFVSITKIGTGLSDDQWKTLLDRLSVLRVYEQPTEYEHIDKTLLPDVWVAPSVVVEIAGDDITKSPTHGAGYAIRFPRMVRVREDKSPSDASTIEEIRYLFEHQ